MEPLARLLRMQSSTASKKRSIGLEVLALSASETGLLVLQFLIFCSASGRAKFEPGRRDA